MKFIRCLLLFLLALSSTGCAAMLAAEGVSEEGKAVNVKFIADENKVNLEKLGYGLSKKAVFKIMGNTPYKLKDNFLVAQPYREETHHIDGKTIEVLYYVTEVKGDERDITPDELTPVVIEDGQYTGYGNLHLGVVGIPVKGN